MLHIHAMLNHTSTYTHYTGIYTSTLQCFIYMPCSTIRLHTHIHRYIHLPFIYMPCSTTCLHAHILYIHFLLLISNGITGYTPTLTHLLKLQMLYIPLQKDTRHAHTLYLAMGQEPGPRLYQEESLIHAASGNR